MISIFQLEGTPQPCLVVYDPEHEMGVLITSGGVDERILPVLIHKGQLTHMSWSSVIQACISQGQRITEFKHRLKEVIEQGKTVAQAYVLSGAYEHLKVSQGGDTLDPDSLAVANSLCYSNRSKKTTYKMRGRGPERSFFTARGTLAFIDLIKRGRLKVEHTLAESQ